MVGKREKPPPSARFPAGPKGQWAPKACAASSIQNRLLSWQSFLISSNRGEIKPARCTTITPAVLVPIRFWMDSGEKVSDDSSISTNTGRPPARVTALALATKVLVGTITSLSRTAWYRNKISRALVPELVATTNASFKCIAAACSIRSTQGPMVSLPDSSSRFNSRSISRLSASGKYGLAGGIKWWEARSLAVIVLPPDFNGFLECIG